MYIYIYNEANAPAPILCGLKNFYTFFFFFYIGVGVLIP